jgi:hypothetical protein
MFLKNPAAQVLFEQLHKQFPWRKFREITLQDLGTFISTEVYTLSKNFSANDKNEMFASARKIELSFRDLLANKNNKNMDWQLVSVFLKHIEDARDKLVSMSQRLPKGRDESYKFEEIWASAMARCIGYLEDRGNVNEIEAKARLAEEARRTVELVGEPLADLKLDKKEGSTDYLTFAKDLATDKLSLVFHNELMTTLNDAKVTGPDRAKKLAQIMGKWRESLVTDYNTNKRLDASLALFCVAASEAMKPEYGEEGGGNRRGKDLQLAKSRQINDVAAKASKAVKEQAEERGRRRDFV